MLFPAHAGMDRLVLKIGLLLLTCSPHTRGWTDQCSIDSFIAQGCSPHTRGWTGFGVDLQRSQGPVPRTRGDGPFVEGIGPLVQVTVPRTRGDGPDLAWICSGPKDLFPAHAGMDRNRCRHRRPLRSCSPHTRGWTDAPAREIQ